MTRHTTGSALGAISTRSNPCSWAIRSASRVSKMPSCEPSTPIRRQLRALISPLILVSCALISVHLRCTWCVSRLYFPQQNAPGCAGSRGRTFTRRVHIKADGTIAVHAHALCLRPGSCLKGATRWRLLPHLHHEIIWGAFRDVEHVWRKRRKRLSGHMPAGSPSRALGRYSSRTESRSWCIARWTVSRGHATLKRWNASPPRPNIEPPSSHSLAFLAMNSSSS